MSSGPPQLGRAEQQKMIQGEAMTVRRTTLGDFVRRKAVEAAEADVLNRTVVTIPAKDWKAFEAWVNRPAKTIAALAKLAKITPRRER
jgi:uncharacterized protein (DUF1778 family)